MARPPGWIVLIVLGCLVLGWWLSNPAPALPPPASGVATVAGSARADTSACPLPPLVARGAAPLQSEVPSSMPTLPIEGATLQPLAGLRGDASSEVARLPFERIRSVTELDARIKAADRPVMLDFYADWCVSCKEMERFTFSDARVQQKLAGWTLLQADVTANSDEDKALLARFKLFGPPGIIFFDSQGKELGNVRVVGFQNAENFRRTLMSTTPTVRGY